MHGQTKIKHLAFIYCNQSHRQFRLYGRHRRSRILILWLRHDILGRSTTAETCRECSRNYIKIDAPSRAIMFC